MNIIQREACLRFFIWVLVFILCNLEKKVLKNDQKLPVFNIKIKLRPKSKTHFPSRGSYDQLQKNHHWKTNIKRDIHVKKIKVGKSV